MSPILLDTHAAVWAANGSLAAPARKLIDAAAEREELLLSPITAWEIAMLVKKGRLTLTATAVEYVQTLFSTAGTITAALTPAIAVTAASLPGNFHRDPADRMLVATAATYGARFVTRDKRIHEYAKETRYLRCILC